MTLDDALDAAQAGSWPQRIEAARSLVKWAGDARADRVLLRLLSDPEDTAPVQVTAKCLVDRATQPALRVFALGWAQADDECGDEMAAALGAAVGSGSIDPEDVQMLSRDDDPIVRAGAESILEWLGK